MNRIPLLAVVVVVACAGDSVLTGVRSDGVTIICNQGEYYYECGPEARPPTTNGGDGNTSGGTTTGTPPPPSTTGSDSGSGTTTGSDTGSGGTGSGSGCGEDYSNCGGSGSGGGSGTGSGDGSGDGGGGGSGGDCQPWPNGPATVLWPPNHKLHTYSLDDCAGITMCPNGQSGAVDGTVTKITVDEAIDVGQGGDGHTTNYDARIVDATHFELRSERQGGGDGRVYTVYYTDASGNDGSCQFLVPHNKGPFEGAVDSGTVVTVLP
jgi:hypothetical protein